MSSYRQPKTTNISELHKNKVNENYELPKKYKTAKYANLEYRVLYYNTDTNLSLVEIKIKYRKSIIK